MPQYNKMLLHQQFPNLYQLKDFSVRDADQLFPRDLDF